jgi:hypothetical protein
MNAAPKEKHLDLLQGVISRLAGNAFLIKGWSVTLVTALLGLAVDGATPALAALALLPALMFWGLDGYFLAQERLFRGIYARVVEPTQEVVDYALNPGPCDRACWWKSTASPTLKWFHGVIVLVILGVVVYLWTLATAPAGGA